jgi:Mg-chelatase subunit ChlD
MSSIKYLLALSLVSTLACSPEIGGGTIEAGPDAGASNPTNPAEICDEAVSISFEQRQVTPDIMLVLDRSGSMGDPLVNGNSTTKWDVMRTAVANVVSNKGDKVNFGLMMFPWGGSCGDGQVRVTPAINSVGPVLQEMNSVSPDGKTPTHQSLARARDYFDGQPVNPDGRIVLLATDGLPVCSSIGQSVDVINQLQQRSIQTYVLGFGFGNVDLSGLQQMASAGGTQQVYTADSPGQLSVSLDAILGDVTVASCDFQLQQTPSNAADINVTINGVDLGRDDPNGWSYDDLSKTITLQGASCESVKAGGASAIEVDLGCEGTIVD